jgi:heptosyltransferase-1
VGVGVRIVLVRLSALGDIVHTWPLAVALAACDPRPHLSWVVEESFKPLVEGHPAVDAVFTTNTRKWRRHPLASSTRLEVAGLKSRLHELQPDLVLDPQGTVKSAMISRWTGAGRRVGLARPWRREQLAGLAYTDTVSGGPAGAHVVATNLALVRSIRPVSPEISHPEGSWLLEKIADSAPDRGGSGTPYAVVLPGSGGAHKVMAVNTLAGVARGLSGLGLEVIVAWGPGEEARAAAVASAAGHGTRLAPPTNLEELAFLLGSAGLVVGGDTGPVHLAASFGVPTLAVFLASDWRRNGPLGRRTAVVSGAGDDRRDPSGSARTRPRRDVGGAEILDAARDLLGR